MKFGKLLLAMSMVASLALASVVQAQDKHDAAWYKKNGYSKTKTGTWHKKDASWYKKNGYVKSKKGTWYKKGGMKTKMKPAGKRKSGDKMEGSEKGDKG